ncbi:MAG TPA: nickel pincer cofactor biosynthesis protein LarB [Thermomicrobiales bacterium]|nr:nickel pincer cofactor biosynthesis protein LarB [Thermomicrobiales bacterium]
MTAPRRPLDDLRAALNGAGAAAEVAPGIRLDPNRVARTGVPEVIFAQSKSPAAVAQALTAQAEIAGRALASRVSDEMAAQVRAMLAGSFAVERHETARALVVARDGAAPPATGGHVGVVAAGTSDAVAAAEAALMAREMGATVTEAHDVGVAGLHRLLGPLERMLEDGVDVIVVAAGMDGALPSVVAGLVPVPVIGLPTAVGYGHGGGGAGALTTMLQSCAPGLVVVNIDNGIGAGATAALIANRVAAARTAHHPPSS